ncbi:COG5342 Invasion protein B, involved in pathogenesis [Rhabdaerophilaceae bacterium]
MKLRFSAGAVAAAFAGLAAFTASSFDAVAQAQQPRPAQRPPAATTPAAPQPPAPVKVPLKASPDQPEWIKVCGDDPTIGKKVCFTTRDFVAENNQPVMGVAIFAEEGAGSRFTRILVPLTFMIPPGVRISAEGLNPVSGRFQICVQQGCFVQADLNEAAINAIKKAKVMRLDMQNQVQQEVHFEIPLEGFTKAYDSAGIDQQTLQRMQEEAARQQQGGAPGQPQPGADDLKRRGEELLRQRTAP